MGLKQQTGGDRQVIDQQTTKIITAIERIFTGYNHQFLEKNNLLDGKGNLDSAKFQSFLVKQGYSEEFARGASEKLAKGGEIKTKDVEVLKLAAKDDLDRKQRESGVTGEIVGSFAIAAIKGTVSVNAWAQRQEINSPEWEKLNEKIKRLRKDSDEGRITRKEYQEGVQTAPAEQQVLLAMLEFRHRSHERDFNVTGGANAVAINQAKDEQELRNLVVNQLQLFTVFEWNRIAAEIGSTYQSLYKPSATSVGMQLAISQMMLRNANAAAEYLNSVSRNAIAKYTEAVIRDRAEQYYDKQMSPEAQRQYKDKEEFVKKVLGLVGGEDGIFMEVRSKVADIEAKVNKKTLTAEELGQYTERLRSATVKVLEIELSA